MTDRVPPATEARLESWKDIAAYLNRDARTVRRWEHTERLPVHRHQHLKRSSVYAFPSELDAWRAGRKPDRKPLDQAPRHTRPIRLAAAAAAVLTLLSAGGGRLVGSTEQGEAASAAGRERLAAAPAEAGSDMALRRVWDGRTGDLLAAYVTSVSGDGRYLTYVPTGTGAVYLHDVATDGDRQLTAADQCAGPPVIARDGSLVAYERYCGAYGSDLRLVSVDSDGLPPPRVLFEDSDVSQITPMDISPDKSLVVVTLVRRDRSRQIGLVSTRDGSLEVLKSVDWRPPTRIFFSPDGRDLAYDLPASDTTQQRDVFVLAVDGSRETRVVEHPANDVVIGWSPDGTQLLFASDRHGGAMALWAQAMTPTRAEQEPVLMTTAINSAWSLGVTNDGTLHLGRNGGDRDVGVVPLDAVTGDPLGPPRRPIQSFIGTNMEPVWSPDGRELAYISWRNNNPIFGDPRVLAIRSIDTGETRELRPNLAYFDQVSWAPDGSAFVTGGRDAQGRDGIFQVHAVTGETTLILQMPLGFERSHPQWGQDGTHIYYRVPLDEDSVNGEVQFMELNLQSGGLREIARGNLGSINLSPDGQWIAAVRRDPSTRAQSVVVIAVDRGDIRELLRVTAPQTILSFFAGLPWTPDGRAILARVRLSEGPELWLVPIGDASPRKLNLDVSDWAVGNRGFISLSPDGRELAFVSGESLAEAWVLENFLSPLESAGR